MTHQEAPRPPRRSLAERLNAHFVACVAVAAAACPDARASIVYSGPVNINIPSNVSGVYLNVVTGVFNSNPALVPGWDINPWSASTLSYFSPTLPTGGVYVVGGGAAGTAPANLPAGHAVSNTSVFGSGIAATTGPFPHVLNSSYNMIGFRFQNEANGNTTHYGWMRIGLAGSLNSQPRAIIEYYYESQPDIPISVGLLSPPPCYVNCDNSSIVPILNVNDFACFLNRFAAGNPYANCDGSSIAPVLNVNDFTCFVNRYAAGCP